MTTRQLSEDEIKNMLAQMQPADDAPTTDGDAAGEEESSASEAPPAAGVHEETAADEEGGPASSGENTPSPNGRATAGEPKAGDEQLPEPSPEGTSAETSPQPEGEPISASISPAVEPPQAAGAEAGETAGEEGEDGEVPAVSAGEAADGDADAPAESADLRIGPNPVSGSRYGRKWVPAGAAAVVVLAGAVLLYISLGKEPEPPPVAAAESAVEARPAAAPAPVEQPVVPSDPRRRSFDKQLEQLTALREEFLIQAGKIARIQADYREAIERVMEEIIAEKRRSAIYHLPRALETSAIALRLATIQRRQAYIRSLEAPIAQLQKSAEDLLYLKRKNEIRFLVVDACSDLSLDKLIEDNERVLQEYHGIPARLRVDLNSVPRRPLEEIWEQVEVREKQYALRAYPESSSVPQKDAAGADREIWEEICSGRFGRKTMLHSLSTQAAACLARSAESDLFLNRIGHLDPAAARKLVEWKGKWLCLNGLRELSPELARTLFAWEGRWISLNGLEHLPFDASMYLSGWNGHTLELMGLSVQMMQHDPLALKHLRLWESSGGKLFVADDIRKLMQDPS